MYVKIYLMPELPEVETIRLQLSKYLIGHKIEGVEVRNPKYEIREKEDIVGAKIIGVRRFAKVLSIDLSNGFSIVVHIKLTGQLIYRGPNLKGKNIRLSAKVVGGVPGPHTHVIFKLDRQGFLYYNDIRRFGWIKVIQSANLKSQSEFIGKLGPEPVVDEKNPPENPLTLEKFEEILSKSGRPIKILLMDQEEIGGVGNIYANDALWLAEINPKRPANRLSEQEAKILYDSIHKVLKDGLKYGGASELAFVTPDGKEGEYQEHTLVYGREGEPCERCHKARIEKYFLYGRGTYFCPKCQV